MKKSSASKSARIINSPSSSCIRRIKNSTASVKCASAAKRLRFDIANTSPLDLENVYFGNINSNTNGNERDGSGGGGGSIRKAKKSMGKIVWRMLFGPCATTTSAATSKSPSKKSSTCYAVASKPLNSFDDVF